MKHWLALLVCLAFVLPAFAQDDDDIYYLKKKKQKTPVVIGTLYPGWTYIQTPFDTSNGNGGNFGSCSSQSGGQTCQMGIFPTTSGSAWVFFVNTTNAVQIDGACAGTNCSVGTSFQNGWTQCSTCHKAQGTGNADLAYATSGAAGTTAVTLHLNGAPGAQFFVMFYEILPPSGTGPAIFDGGAAVSSAACSSGGSACVLAAPTITGTDGVIHVPITGGTGIGPIPVNVFNNPFFQDYNGILYGLNVTSSTVNPTYSQASNTFIDVAISFKTTTAFTPSSDNTFYQLVQEFNNQSLGPCNTTCSPAFTTSGNGNLIMVIVGDGNTQYISSVTDGTNTFTTPAGCQVAMSGTPANRMSCSYLLSSASGKTLTITMGGNSTIGVSIWEYSRLSGSFAADGSPVTGQDAACSICSGAALTPTGTHGDILFQAMFCPGGCNDNTLYPIASNTSGNGMALTVNSSAVSLPNTKNGTAPSWGFTNNPTSFLGIAIQ